jgi:hypothetical protein
MQRALQLPVEPLVRPLCPQPSGIENEPRSVFPLMFTKCLNPPESEAKKSRGRKLNCCGILTFQNKIFIYKRMKLILKFLGCSYTVQEGYADAPNATTIMFFIRLFNVLF